MLVNWKHPRILVLGHMSAGGVTLKPGVNDVDPELWKVASQNILAKHYLKTDDLEVVEDAQGAPMERDDLGKLNEKRAIKLIKDTTDAELLTLWHEDEARKPVVRAIESQLEALAKAAEPGTEDAKE